MHKGKNGAVGGIWTPTPVGHYHLKVACLPFHHDRIKEERDLLKGLSLFVY